MDLKEEEALGADASRHWYYVSKARAIRDLARSAGGAREPQPILDVGAGSGVIARMMMEEGVASRARCVDLHYEPDWIAAHSSEEIRFQTAVTPGEERLVLMIDVIEHVEDDVALLQEAADAVPAGARFVVSAPAFQFLWSSHDVFLEHHRRYTGDMMRRSIEAAGLEPLKVRFFYGGIFPVAAVVKTLDRMRGGEPKSQMGGVPAPLNAALIAAHDVERAVLFPLNALAGVTVFCLAEKP
ncbi:MAG: methyltransferase domain-containing protein [Pseudomonadota bacterium]